MFPTKKEILISNIDKIDTTDLGIKRIKNNLELEESYAIEYCKEKIKDKNSIIYEKGKNLYCEIDNIKITINKNSYTIITAHKIKS